ncbi:MAG: hypothetical protein ACLQU1_25695 [Bryobacteraceae bacterium]
MFLWAALGTGGDPGRPSVGAILRRRTNAGVLPIKALGGGWSASDRPRLSTLRRK